MKYCDLFESLAEREHCRSQREASELLLGRSANYISSYRDALVSADDGIRVWRKLVELRDHELAARVLIAVLDGAGE